MKKTIRINISGLIFNLDEDAYSKLQQYLNSITNKFLNTEEGNEVIADVEARIAELFQEKVGDRKEVINLEDIDFIIEIMGKPEDFDEIYEPEEEPHYKSQHSTKSSRRVYRDPDNRVVSGLSSGIAAYLGIDPVIVRVIFVLATLFYGASLLVYILLWIIIPDATTTSQKLEMRGEAINVENIEKSIKDEFSHVKTSFSKWQNSKGYSNLSDNVSSIVHFIGKVAVVAVKVILVIFGIWLFFMSLGVLGSFTGIFFFNDTIISPFTWNDINFAFTDLIKLFTDPFTAIIGMISLYLLVIVPALAIIYFSLKMIFRFKVRNRAIGIIGITLWLVSLMTLVVAGFRTAYNFKSDAEITKDYTLNTNMDTLFIQLKNPHDNYSKHSTRERFNRVYVDFENNLALSGKPRLRINKSNNDKTKISIIRESRGMTKDIAFDNAKNISYDWQQDDSLLILNRYFQINGTKKVRDQELNIYLSIPVGKTIYLGKHIFQIAHDIDNVQNIYDGNMTEEYWIMTEDGLSLLDDAKPTNEAVIEESENETDTTKTGIIEIEKIKTKVEEDDEIKQMKKELDSM
ncbi:MAG: PspC domain-containing protein [Bacteroidota bacterium]